MRTRRPRSPGLLAGLRRSLAVRRVVLAAALFATFGLPALHSLVHVVEAQGPGRPAAREGALAGHAPASQGVHRHPGGVVHVHAPVFAPEAWTRLARTALPAPPRLALSAAPAHDQQHHGHRHGHGDGGSPGDSDSDFTQHGKGSAEHLQLALQRAPALPVLAAPVASLALAPPVLSDRLAFAEGSGPHGIRGPPLRG